MLKSKSVVFEAPKIVALREKEICKPGSREVVIRSIYTLVSIGTELTILNGEFPKDSGWAQHTTYPFYPGYNNVGEIISIGQEVDELEKGQKVFCWGPHSQFFLKNLDERSNVGGLFKGVYKIPSGIDLKDVTFATFAQIALNGIRLGEVSLGESSVVIGVGPIGQLTVQLLRLSGSYPIIAVDLSKERLKLSQKNGADFTIVPGEKTLKEDISRLTRTRLADVIFEVTGNPEVIPSVLKLLRTRGRLVILGTPRDKVTVDFATWVQTPGIRIIGAHNGIHTPYETPYNQWTLERDYEFFIDLVKLGRIDVKSLTSHVFSWRESTKIYQSLLEDRTRFMGIVLDWTEK